MVPPVAAPDEIVELHDALVATPLDDVETLRRLAWRARAIAAKRPGDFPVVLTAALGLAQSGQRAEAVAFAERAFNLRNTAILGRDEIISVLLWLILFDDAKKASKEICKNKAFSNSFISISTISKAAFLNGDVDLLREILDFSSEKHIFFPKILLNIIEIGVGAEFFNGHMQIYRRYVEDSCCYVEFSTDGYNHNPSAHIEYRLNLPFDECLKRFDALGEELRAYYIAAGRDDLPYLNVISHSLSPMPAYWIDAT